MTAPGGCDKKEPAAEAGRPGESAVSRILIDGYNLLHALDSWSQPGGLQVEDLLALLRDYRRVRRHTVTVVLDGYERGMPVERSERVQGIGLVYSRLGEKADQVIERMVRRWGGSCVVVTSDRKVAAAVEGEGAAVIGSREFAARLEEARYLALKGGEAEETEEPSRPRDAGRKKGNPRRLGKKERARRRRLRGL